MLALTISMLLGARQPVTRSNPEYTVVMACDNWLANRHDSHRSGEVHRTKSGGVCFDGQIDAESAKAFVAALAALPSGASPIVVVRSVGGDVDAGLDMADALRPRHATVIARTLCASSCANYVLPAGAHRVVLKDTLLAFHGGALRLPASAFLDALRKQGVSDPEAQARAAQARLTRMAIRQDAFLATEHIDPDFFGWMERYNHLSSVRKAAICPNPAGAIFFVFSPALLARHGYTFTRYDGPTSRQEVNAVMAKLKVPASAACFVDEAHGDF